MSKSYSTRYRLNEDEQVVTNLLRQVADTISNRADLGSHPLVGISEDGNIIAYAVSQEDAFRMTDAMLLLQMAEENQSKKDAGTFTNTTLVRGKKAVKEWLRKNKDG